MINARDRAKVLFAESLRRYKPWFQNVMAGKRALVTGGLPYGVSHGFAILLREAGANVSVTGPSATELSTLSALFEEERGEPLQTYAVDFSDPTRAANFGDTFCEQVGIPDILVNVAGVTPARGGKDPLAYSDAEVLNINLLGPRCLTNVILGKMLLTHNDIDPGRILCIGSILGRCHTQNHGIYSITKIAVEAWVRELAELGQGKVIALGFAPAWVVTAAMLECGLNERETAIGVPAKRLPCPVDLAAFSILAACSPAGYMGDGHTVLLDGGLLSQFPARA